MIFIRLFFSIIFVSILLIITLVNISNLLSRIVLNFKLIALAGKYFTFQALVLWLRSNWGVFFENLILNSFPTYGFAYIIFRKYILIQWTCIDARSEPIDFILLSWDVLQILCRYLIEYVSFLFALWTLFIRVFFYVLLLLLYLFFYLLRFLLFLSFNILNDLCFLLSSLTWILILILLLLLLILYFNLTFWRLSTLLFSLIISVCLFFFFNLLILLLIILVRIYLNLSFLLLAVLLKIALLWIIFLWVWNSLCFIKWIQFVNSGWLKLLCLFQLLFFLFFLFCHLSKFFPFLVYDLLFICSCRSLILFLLYKIISFAGYIVIFWRFIFFLSFRTCFLSILSLVFNCQISLLLN